MASPNNIPLHNFALPDPNWPAQFKSARSSACNGDQSSEQQHLHVAGQQGRPLVRRFRLTVPVHGASAHGIAPTAPMVDTINDDLGEENLNLLLNLKGNNDVSMADDNDDNIVVADLKGKGKVGEDDYQGNDNNNNNNYYPMEVDEVVKLSDNDNEEGMKIEMAGKKIPRKQVFRRRRNRNRNTACSSSSAAAAVATHAPAPAAAKKPEVNHDGNNGTNNDSNTEKTKKVFVRQRSNADHEIVKEAMKSNSNQFALTLTRKEIEDDYLLMTGTRLPRKSMRRPKQLQALLQVLFPGSDLGLVSPRHYQVD